MTVLANLDVILGAKTGQYDRGMSNAEQRTNRFTGSSNRASAGLSKLTASFRTAAAGAVSFGAAYSFKKVAAEIDLLAKTSDKLGIATEKLGAMQFAAAQTGVSAETLNMAMQRMVRRVSEAANGTGEAKDAIKELGIDAKQLAALSPDEQFRVLADSMAGVASEGDRVRLAMKLFDSEGVALVNTLALGRQGLDDMEDEARRLGVLIDRDTARSFESFNDNVHRLESALRGGFIPAALDTVERLNDIADSANEAFKALSSLGESQGVDVDVRSVGERITKGFGFAGDYIRDIMDFGVSMGRGGKARTENIAALEIPTLAQFDAAKDAQEKATKQLEGFIPLFSSSVAGGSALANVFGSIAGGVAGGNSAIGKAIGKPLEAQAARQRQWLDNFSRKTGPEAVSGASALDQARRNRESNSISDEQVKLMRKSSMGIDKTNELMERLIDVVGEWTGVEVAG